MPMRAERRFTIIGAALLLAATLAPHAAPAWLSAAASDASNWPQFRGPNRDGKSADTNLLKQWDADGPALVWKTSGLGTGYSSLSIGGDRLFTMGDIDGSQYVLALSAADGKQLWKAKIGPTWVDRYPGPRSTPTVDGATIYALGTEGDLMALDAATGKVRWRKNLPRDFGGMVMSDWKFAESPLVDGDRLIVTPGGADAAMVALNKATGATIWKAKVPA
jgi:outer membrane protein assembly factor BamB